MDQVHPSIASKTRWVAMAGSVYRGYEPKEVSKEYNVAIFATDAQKVFAANWHEAVIAPLDVAVVSLTGENYQRIRERDTALTRIIQANYVASLKHTLARQDPSLSPEDVDRRAHQQVQNHSSPLFDTVPVYLFLSRDAVRIERLPIRVTDDGYTTIDRKAGKPVQCATAWTDLPAFKQFLVERLTR